MPAANPTSGAGRRPLFVDADLDMTVDGHAVAVRGSGQRVTIEVEDRPTAFRLARASRPGARGVRTLSGVLEEHGVDVEIHVGGEAVGRLGPSAEVGRIADALGLPVEVTPEAIPRRALWAAAGLALLGGIVVAYSRR